MSEQEKMVTSPEEDLVEVLMDFIIVAATLAKKVSRVMKTSKVKEGGAVNGKNERTAADNRQPAIRGSIDL